MRTRHSTTPTRESDQNLFDRLPSEILLEIIKYVRTFNSIESVEIVKKKESHAVCSDLGRLKLWTYEQPQVPLLNTFQSFASVDRRIYQLSRHILWEAIDLPSSVPVSMSLWTDSILPRQGLHVRSVKLSLTREWYEVPTKRIVITRSLASRYHQYSLRPRHLRKLKTKADRLVLSDLDNLSLWRFDWSAGRFSLNSQGLSFQNVTRLLSLTPYLHTFKLTSPPSNYHDPDQGDMTMFRINLSSLLSQLPHLRHFQISAPPVSSLLSTAISEPITRIPSLESLSCSDICQGSETHVKEFAKAISGLRHLTKLRLSHVYDLDDRWESMTGPPELVELEIKNCWHVWLTKAPDFISRWAPNLTHLTLRFSWNIESQYDSLDTFEMCDHRFNLPHLTHLTLWHRVECDYYYEAFLECEKVESLTYHDLTESSCDDFVEFISDGFFPKLKRLNLPQPSWADNYVTNSKVFEQAYESLEEYAEECGIEVVHSIS